jgi:putative hemolysin
MTFELQLFLLAVCLTGVFLYAGSETGFVSLNRIKVSHLADGGVKSGRWCMYLFKNKTRFLSSILIGSNICIVGSSLFFNSLFLKLSDTLPVLSHIPSPESWFLTPIVVLFCEMLPKSLFRLYSFELTLKFIPFLMASYFIFLPLSWVTSLITGEFRKRGKGDNSSKQTLREEMVMVAAEGARTGAIFESSNSIIENVLRLKKLSMNELKLALKDVQKGIFFKTDSVFTIKKHHFKENEIIIYKENGVEPVGVVYLDELVGKDEHLLLASFLRPLVTVDMTSSVGAALKMILSYRGNVIFLKDTAGRIDGVVKKRDIISTIFVLKNPQTVTYQQG